jgi:hypothetical protein
MNRGRRPTINLAIYGTGLAYLVRNPTIIVIPLVIAVADALVSYWSGLVTDPMGGLGGGLIGFALQILYLFAFAAAIVQANNIVRGYRGGFDASWEETRGKIGGILIAALGFQFVSTIAVYIAQILNIGALGLVLQLVADFFLIMTMPAAAIGGLPGQFALSGSIRTVRANWPACLILAIVFVVLWFFIPNEVAFALAPYGPFAATIGQALARAIVLAYLAFPFAVTYDETAFRGFR